MLGYPNTNRFTLDGFVVQGTQRVLLQWHPENQTMQFVNIFDRLHDQGLDPVLQATYQVPLQAPNDPSEAGKTFAQIATLREEWLNDSPPLKAHYLDDPYRIDHFGLPTSHVADFGPFLAVRLQRRAFQLWKANGPGGIVAGQVAETLGSDIAKAVNFYPQAAVVPVAAPTSAPGTAPTRIYGFDAQVVGGREAPVLQAVKGAGFGWVKQQVRWIQQQPLAAAPPGWGELDAVADSAAAAGIKVLFSITAAPPWATVPGADFPQNPQDLANFMGAMATHFRGKVQAYEIWNEENFATEVGPGHINAGQYVETLRLVYPAIKSADPTAIVVSGAPTPTGVNDPGIAMDDLAYLTQMYQYQNGVVKAFFDVLGAHPQGYGNAPEETVQQHTQLTFSNHPSFFFRRAEDYRNLMVQVGDGNKPIWATETGYDSNPLAPTGYEYARTITEAQQADYLVREIRYVQANWPWMGALFIWNLNFQAVVPQTDEKWGFGVLHPDYSPRPAYTALQQVPKL